MVSKVPLIPLRDVVVFPYINMPLFIGRKTSIEAVEAAVKGKREVFLVAQKDKKIEDPGLEEVYSIGTIASITHVLKLPDNTLKILVEGKARAQISSVEILDSYTEAHVNKLDFTAFNDIEVRALMRATFESFEEFSRLNKKVPDEILRMLKETEEVARFSSVLLNHLQMSIEQRQNLLENNDIEVNLNFLFKFIRDEIEVLETEKKIQSRVRKQMESNQRDYYLNEQIKSIQKELGNNEDEDEIGVFKEKIENARMPKEAREKAEGEVKKLLRMQSHSSDASIVRTYLDHLCNLPWRKKTRINKNLHKAKDILDQDHYGLDKVKECILEHLAVQIRTTNIRANILCLVGPPGVGKTSLGESIAKAVARKYVRMSLGGVRDEAEIRGHRRTYIGAMPGAIIQKMQKVGVNNPLFLLDEIDKMSADYRGDPSSAMLEVLDPEQNHTFNDHYLEVDYDLSKVMFVATANSKNLPPALLDRMEVIELSGYTEDEKLEIAKRHLVKKNFEQCGIKSNEIQFEDSALLNIIRYYTREAGVRNLNRAINTICRKTVMQLLLKEESKTTNITEKNIETYLGVKKFRLGVAETHNQIGQVTGLAWTAMGGDLLTIEAATYKGKGKIVKPTGNLKEVMTESTQVAMSVIRSRLKSLSIAEDFYEKLDIHIHVPDGSTPKDGPSAGVAMCIALISALTKRKVRSDIAMTGEINLRGEIMPVGGLKEKMLAALRGGIKTVIIPHDNEREFSEVPQKVVDSLNVVKAKWIDEVMDLSLEESNH